MIDKDESNVGSNAEKGLVARLKLRALDLVDHYHGVKGIGSDAYSAVPLSHPMADAKFLLALVALLNAKVISPQRFVQYAAPVGPRLESARIPLFGSGAAWGLGFCFRKLPAREPYLITSALTVEALSAAAATGLVDPVFESLHQAGMHALASWLQCWVQPYPGVALALPQYSEHLQEPVINAAAYAFGVVARSDSDPVSHQAAEARRKLSMIAGLRIPGIGWQYSASSGIVDLVHQCYIINAFPPDMCPMVNEWHADLVSMFDGGTGYLDVCTLVADESGLASSPELPIVRRISGRCVRVERKPARLWSLGELLVSLSRQAGLIEDEQLRLQWKRTANRVAGHILDLLDTHSREAGFVRHSMHGLHGIAELLAMYRSGMQASDDRWNRAL